MDIQKAAPELPQTLKKRVRLPHIRSVFLILLFSALSMALGYAFGIQGYEAKVSDLTNIIVNRDTPTEHKDVDFSLFWGVWDTLDAAYFDSSKLDSAEMVYGAIKGMVASLGDPYTVFLTKRENEVTQEDLSGNFSGIGIQIGFRGTQLAVISPLPGSPAEQKGVQPGDYILGIKDESKDIETGTNGMSLPEAVQIIRGEPDSVVTLSLLREGIADPFLVDITRETIDVPSVVLEFVGKDESVAHVQILKFGAETAQEWDDAVLEIQKKENLSGIVLDVRNNPGGYLQAAVDLSAEFLQVGDVVVIEEYADGKQIEFTTDRLGKLVREKVVMLVNGGSASASEILSGALRDQRGFKLVGQTTFGKGTIQEPRQLPDGVGLHITVARWLTPKEAWVNEVGLEPDVVVEESQDTPEDDQLQEAIRLLSE